jgi:hypothetical protein
MEEKLPSEFSMNFSESSLRRKHDSDSIVRGILSNSIKYNHEKQSGLDLIYKKKEKIFMVFFF